LPSAPVPAFRQFLTTEKGDKPMNTAQPTPHYFNDIINGDCLKVLPKLAEGSVDFILTDPPYLVGYKDRSGRSIQNDDNDGWLKPAFADMYRVLARDSFCISFYGWPMQTAL
jgi:DNA modification methylase